MKTKTNPLLILTAALIMSLNTGCGFFSNEEEYSRYEETLDSMVVSKDSAIEKLTLMLVGVEHQLALLNSHTPMLNLNSERNDNNHKLAQEVIFAEIAVINAQINDSKDKIAELKGKLSSASKEKTTMSKMIAMLNRQLYDSEKRVEQLQDKLSEMGVFSNRLNASLDSMLGKSKEQSEQIALLQLEMNTAFYTFGTYKELKEQGIVTKQGGFLGLFGRTKVPQQNFNKSSYFNRINKEETHFIPVYAKNVQLLTNHPSGSYKFVAGENGSVELIEITDPEKFWDTSDYLIAMVE